MIERCDVISAQTVHVSRRDIFRVASSEWHLTNDMAFVGKKIIQDINYFVSLSYIGSIYVHF